jgi:hypothetical protein
LRDGHIRRLHAVHEQRRGPLHCCIAT